MDELFATEKFDTLHVHDLPLAKVGYEAKCTYGVRFVLDLHENWPVLLQLSKHTNTFLGKLLSSNAQWVRYEKEMCGLADKIIVVVDEAKGRVSGLGINPEKIEVVSNTLDICYLNTHQALVSHLNFSEHTGMNKSSLPPTLILSYALRSADTST